MAYLLWAFALAKYLLSLVLTLCGVLFIAALILIANAPKRPRFHGRRL